MKNKDKQKLWKKGIVLSGCMLLVCAMAGCKKKGTEPLSGDSAKITGGVGQGISGGIVPGNPGNLPQQGEQGQAGEQGSTKKEEGKTVRTEADYPNGLLGNTGRLMRYGNGLYYDKHSKGLYYVDLEKGRELPLCNKPECRHDGNLFCVATNKKYTRGAGCIYKQRLLMVAVEQKDTQYLFKLLSIALDGSGMEELITFYTLEEPEKFNINMGNWQGGSLFVHRGKAIFSVQLMGQENLEDTAYCGNFVIDLETKEVSPLGEELLSKELTPAQNLQAWGDSVFYYRQDVADGEPKRTYTLYEYDILDKTVRACSLQSGFQGKYAVFDDDTIYYYRTKKTELWAYHRKTGQSERVLEFKRVFSLYFADGSVTEEYHTFEGDGIASDGTYLYILETAVNTNGGAEDGNVLSRMLHAYDGELNLLASVDVAGAVRALSYEGEGVPLPEFLKFEFTGEDIFARCAKEVNGITYANGPLIYKIKRSGLLAGKINAEWVYEIE